MQETSTVVLDEQAENSVELRRRQQSQDSFYSCIENLINQRVWRVDERVKKLIQEKESLEAEVLIKEQIMQAMKLQEKQQEAMHQEQLEELRDKLERKEYVC